MSHPSSDDMSVATGDGNDLCLPGLRTVLEIKSCSCSIITSLRMIQCTFTTMNKKISTFSIYNIMTDPVVLRTH